MGKKYIFSCFGDLSRFAIVIAIVIIVIVIVLLAVIIIMFLSFSHPSPAHLTTSPLPPTHLLPPLSPPSSSWKKYECSDCQKILNGKKEWDSHIKSKKHKGTLKRKRRREREGERKRGKGEEGEERGAVGMEGIDIGKKEEGGDEMVE